ncbi:hypothetical protein Nhal_0227 [Nitrosococcus halophilus Nc 4]|uniref:PspA-associated domain-containing protein n=1 Tax=Nitrosococcus halophilus (strain Nc4) TaxID=472759 RepID=D5BUN0_NITHN|nr:hypothetical protein [Nitrosococcus halophilus]ADE13430.1 hypothetical protein Nhal_0227 [Nitrosococcus halophilus Nc 4]
MIIRIMSEGQYRMPSGHLDQLNDLDAQVVLAVAQGDQAHFQTTYAQMLDFVRQQGEPVAATELVESDVILPAPDLELKEAQQLFKGEGIIPG